jgi:hypothetical protein
MKRHFGTSGVGPRTDHFVRYIRKSIHLEGEKNHKKNKKKVDPPFSYAEKKIPK